MKYSEYLILVLATFETITTKWLCATNEVTYLKTEQYNHDQKLSKHINILCKGNNFITTEIPGYHTKEYYTEYRRYILRRLIGETQLKEKS